MEEGIIIKNMKQSREEKDNCFICRRHKTIAEEHYIVPLAEVKAVIKKEYKDEIIYLCPNCHSYLHLILSNKNDLIDNVYNYFRTEDMRKRLAKIISRYYYLKSKNERCKNANR